MDMWKGVEVLDDSMPLELPGPDDPVEIDGCGLDRYMTFCVQGVMRVKGTYRNGAHAFVQERVAMALRGVGVLAKEPGDDFKSIDVMTQSMSGYRSVKAYEDDEGMD